MIEERLVISEIIQPAQIKAIECEKRILLWRNC